MFVAYLQIQSVKLGKIKNNEKMKALKKFIIVGLIANVFSNISLYSQTKYRYWINIEYMRCLSNNIPCKCSSIKSKYSFAITENNMGKIKTFWNRNLNENEIDEYQIKKYTSTNKNFAIVLGDIFIKKNVITLHTKDGKIVKYQFLMQSDTFSENYCSIKILEQINDRIKRKNDKSIYDFVPINAGCDCNNELGKINLITKRGDSKSWLLEKQEDGNKIILYEIIDREDGKTINTSIVKKYIYSFNLR